MIKNRITVLPGVKHILIIVEAILLKAQMIVLHIASGVAQQEVRENIIMDITYPKVHIMKLIQNTIIMQNP